MNVAGDFYTTEEAAAALGVTTRRVQQMLDQGVLDRLARGLVDATSLDRYLASARGGRTRVWSEPTAWGAIAYLSGHDVDWLGVTQASRLKAALGHIDAIDLAKRTRDRAVTHVYQAHSSVLEKISADLVVTDSLRLGLVDGVGIDGVAVSGFAEKDASGRVAGYLAAASLADAVKRYGLVESSSGSLTVRTTTFDLDIVRSLANARTPVLDALDAAAALDPRERGMGLVALDTTLDRYRP